MRSNRLPDGIRRRGKAQALVEFAVMGTLLGMLLAGAVDLGRAYYTSVVVANMAAEGASYAAIHPDRDSNYPAAGSCGRFSITSGANDVIQERARRVALSRGLVIRRPEDADVAVLDSLGATSDCTTRCAGTVITVRVTYRITDLFIPGLLGLNSITIRKASSQRLQTSAFIVQDVCAP